MNLDLMAFFSRNSLPKTKDGAYVINFDEHSKETHQVSLFIDKNTTIYFDSFELNIFFKKY